MYRQTLRGDLVSVDRRGPRWEKCFLVFFVRPKNTCFLVFLGQPVFFSAAGAFFFPRRALYYHYNFKLKFKTITFTYL